MSDIEQLTGHEINFIYPTWLKDKETCPECKTRPVKGKTQGNDIVYLKTDTGRELRHCSECDERLFPTAANKAYIMAQKMANLDQRLRDEYGIPYDKNVRAWMEENHSKHDKNGNYIVNNYADLVRDL